MEFTDPGRAGEWLSRLRVADVKGLWEAARRFAERVAPEIVAHETRAPGLVEAGAPPRHRPGGPPRDEDRGVHGAHRPPAGPEVRQDELQASVAVRGDAAPGGACPAAPAGRLTDPDPATPDRGGEPLPPAVAKTARQGAETPVSGPSAHRPIARDSNSWTRLPSTRLERPHTAIVGCLTGNQGEVTAWSAD